MISRRESGDLQTDIANSNDFKLIVTHSHGSKKLHLHSYFASLTSSNRCGDCFLTVSRYDKFFSQKHAPRYYTEYEVKRPVRKTQLNRLLVVSNAGKLRRGVKSACCQPMMREV